MKSGGCPKRAAPFFIEVPHLKDSMEEVFSESVRIARLSNRTYSFGDPPLSESDRRRLADLKTFFPVA